MPEHMLFVHGLNSSGKGFKGRFFATLFPRLLTPDFTGTVEQRMLLLETILEGSGEWTLIGSSLGGLMAAIEAGRRPDTIKKLILLAPALRRRERDSGILRTVSCPVTIFHGLRDEVIDIAECRVVATEIFTDLRFFQVNDDHFLHDTVLTVDWCELIGAGPDTSCGSEPCERR